jgi:murein DD-endopeptidase MepM/ murein hydrolase activator NlpD
VGKSPRRYSSESDALAGGREDAYTQILQFYGELLQSRFIDETGITGTAKMTGLINQEPEISGFAHATAAQTESERFTELYRNEKDQTEYRVFLLYQFPRQEAEDKVQGFEKNISRRYETRVAVQDTLADTLALYDGILADLDANPLHRALASYEEESPGNRPSGQRGDHCPRFPPACSKDRPSGGFGPADQRKRPFAGRSRPHPGQHLRSRGASPCENLSGFP